MRKIIIQAVFVCLSLFSGNSPLNPWKPVFTGHRWEIDGYMGEMRPMHWGGLTFDLVQVIAPADPESWLWAAWRVRYPDGHALDLSAGAVVRGQRVTLYVSGPMATPLGIDWSRCEPRDGDYCRLARLVESTAPDYPDLPLPGRSNLFIQTGDGPRVPQYGFLVWRLSLGEGLTVGLPRIGKSRRNSGEYRAE